jgi:hypothetical protein
MALVESPGCLDDVRPVGGLSTAAAAANGEVPFRAERRCMEDVRECRTKKNGKQKLEFSLSSEMLLWFSGI